MITCIVAMDEQAHIGFQGHMPWHIPEELYLFQQLTLHHTILMGRKTWESIGRPLPERKMLIASRTKHEYPYEQVQIVKDVTAILQYYQHSKEELRKRNLSAFLAICASYLYIHHQRHLSIRYKLSFL